jgi:hypothetical protein
MPSSFFLAAENNVTIDGSGQEQFGKSNFCKWLTSDGSTSIITVTNAGVANTLTLVISGAPATIIATDGSPLNGQHTIPPNSPSTNVTAIGNFLGQQVIVFNMSALDTPCSVVTVVPSMPMLTTPAPPRDSPASSVP